MSTVPDYPSGRFLHLLISFLIRRGVVRCATRRVYERCGYPNVGPCDAIVGKCNDRDAFYICHEIDATIVRFALFIREHAWDLDRLCIRLGLKVTVVPGDYFANARWRWSVSR